MAQPLPKHLRVSFTRRFQSSLSKAISTTVPKVERLWDHLDDYDEDSVEDFTVAAASPMQTLKVHAMRQAVGYYTVLAGVRTPSISPRELAITPNLRDPFISVWRALASGAPLDQAILAGKSRLEAVVANFANSASRQTGDIFVDKAHLEVRGWERITNAGACAWCEEVADAIYASADSADFGHDRCGCTAAPAFT